MLSASAAGPPAWFEHRRSKDLDNGLERGHGHLKQRLYLMRGSKFLASASVIARVTSSCRMCAVASRGLRMVYRTSSAWQPPGRSLPRQSNSVFLHGDRLWLRDHTSRMPTSLQQNHLRSTLEHLVAELSNRLRASHLAN